ncbi:MAG: hypothetical protein JNM75_03010 [Rhodospirillales bacterium]|nr:hypothetical protein [Rhodospirillales bacterium]
MFMAIFENEKGETFSFGQGAAWTNKEMLIDDLLRSGFLFAQSRRINEHELEELRQSGCWSFSVGQGTRSITTREVEEALTP